MNNQEVYCGGSVRVGTRSLYNALVAIRDEYDPYSPPGFGLCSEVSVQTINDKEGVRDLMGRIWERWPKYSGCPLYPVPDPEHPGDAAAAERVYDRSTAVLNAASGHWDERTPYGALRWELLRYMIATLEQDYGCYE